MTKNQIKTFWPVFAAACRELGLGLPEEKDRYRMRVMTEEANAGHLADVSPCAGYERVMARLYSDAGDFVKASEFALAADKRQAAMVEDCARQVFELDGREGGDVAEYVNGILQQSGMKRETVSDTWWLDYPQATPRRIFMMLDSRRRQLVRRWLVYHPGANIRMGYEFGKSWIGGGDE